MADDWSSVVTDNCRTLLRFYGEMLVDGYLQQSRGILWNSWTTQKSFICLKLHHNIQFNSRQVFVLRRRNRENRRTFKEFLLANSPCSVVLIYLHSHEIWHTQQRDESHWRAIVRCLVSKFVLTTLLCLDTLLKSDETSIKIENTLSFNCSFLVDIEGTVSEKKLEKLYVLTSISEVYSNHFSYSKSVKLFSLSYYCLLIISSRFKNSAIIAIEIEK